MSISINNNLDPWFQKGLMFDVAINQIFGYSIVLMCLDLESVVLLFCADFFSVRNG